MCTTICHELCHGKKAWPGTLVDPCPFSLITPRDENMGGGGGVNSPFMASTDWCRIYGY